LSVTRRKRKR